MREVLRTGYLHGATGAVLVPAIVRASSASAAAPLIASTAAASPTATPRGTRVHRVGASDSLPGLALRYDVPLATIMRLNRLPTAQALHSRQTIRLLPMQATSVVLQVLLCTVGNLPPGGFPLRLPRATADFMMKQGNPKQ